MAGIASKENGKKGGRPKGSLSNHTLDAIAVKNLYIEKAKEHAQPILEALVKKALTGDIPAIREFNDRAFGKAPQAITGANGEALKVVFDAVFNNAPTSSPETNS